MDLILPQPEDDFDRGLLAYVNDPGWMVAVIPEDLEGPGFAFTVGLTYSFGHPELLIYGLPQENAHGILNTAGNRIKDGVQRFSADSTDADLFEDNRPAALREIHPSQYPDHLGAAMWFYQNLPAPFPALQIFWPDPDHHFPWHPACDPRCRSLQPLLHQPLV